MKLFGEIDMSGVKKIVINRTIVWQREDRNGILVWVKTAGGKGYDATCPLIYHPHEMVLTVNEILVRPKKKMLPCGDVIVVGMAYHAWQSGDTLNVARKKE
jgi:hypothetical protein